MLFQCDLDKLPLRGKLCVPTPSRAEVGTPLPMEVVQCDFGRQVIQRTQLCLASPFQDACAGDNTIML